MTSRKKLPQNIQALIGEIGEKQVLLRLYLLVHENSWDVFHNLGEAGFDVLLQNSTTGEKIRVEVKTRQKLYTTGKNIHRVHFFLTDGEYQACDYLIASLRVGGRPARTRSCITFIPSLLKPLAYMEPVTVLIALSGLAPFVTLPAI